MLQYPQYIFSTEILKLVGKKNLSNYKKGIDIPCGSGYTTYYLSKGNAISWLGVDVDKTSIDFAVKKFSGRKVTFQINDIFLKLQKLKDVDILCVINSIFLLPDHDRLFNLVYSCLNTEGEGYFIIPNVDSKNYHSFINKNPNVNVKEYRIDVLVGLLAKINLVTQNVKGICYANMYGRKEIRFMSRLAPYYLIALNYIMTFWKAGTPSYFLIKIKKATSPNPPKLYEEKNPAYV